MRVKVKVVKETIGRSSGKERAKKNIKVPKVIHVPVPGEAKGKGKGNRNGRIY